MNNADENIELDVIGNNEEGNPVRIHFEYSSNENKITFSITDVYKNEESEKISFTDKTLINFAKAVANIRENKV